MSRRPWVNLNLAHALLVTADGQPYGFLKVRSADLIREVELMAAAGLVEASLGNTDTEAYAVINCVTAAGQASCALSRIRRRKWRSSHPPNIDRLTAYGAEMLSPLQGDPGVPEAAKD